MIIGNKERGRGEETQKIKTFSYSVASRIQSRSARGVRSLAIGTKKLTHVYAHTQFYQRGGEAAIIFLNLSLSSVP